ncbi:conserved hypothetical protein [Aspergillus terreus NIH2624]|uniref:AB hydrolase-1 domain-containing protein n=1 Tax=Aspergillus terreus (strain NIH 2624 / FGSC A1156) TaxID=341663 RepID=Q0CLN9_ASPTN|nr:uncharacterized protein ATEG_05395 [Aspergillus terreus NIH2624]EAU34464.1 conserved hypothetical protein [Aspergillus terreus NIH2624]
MARHQPSRVIRLPKYIPSTSIKLGYSPQQKPKFSHSTSSLPTTRPSTAGISSRRTSARSTKRPSTQTNPPAQQPTTPKPPHSASSQMTPIPGSSLPFTATPPISPPPNAPRSTACYSGSPPPPTRSTSSPSTTAASASPPAPQRRKALITDGVALLNFLTAGPLRIPPSRIVLMGQSLGTAVSAAVAERFAFGSPDPAAIQPAIKDPEPFAGVILLASFSNLPNLIESYSLKGLTPPMLSPLMGYPRVQAWVKSHIVDTWDTAARVARLTGVAPGTSDAASTSKELDLAIIHAKNDVEIPWYEGRQVWVAATGENVKDAPGSIVYQRKDSNGPNEVLVWENRAPDGSAPVRKVRWERVAYGGHNRVATFTAAAISVLRAFDE